MPRTEASSRTRSAATSIRRPPRGRSCSSSTTTPARARCASSTSSSPTRSMRRSRPTSRSATCWSDPHPLDFLDGYYNEKNYCCAADTNDDRFVIHRDKYNRMWARRDGTTSQYNFYPVQEGFFFPSLETQPPVGTLVGWLNCLSVTNPTLDSLTSLPPLPWEWRATWPADDKIPTMRIGQTLSTAVDGLPEVWNASLDGGGLSGAEDGRHEPRGHGRHAHRPDRPRARLRCRSPTATSPRPTASPSGTPATCSCGTDATSSRDASDPLGPLLRRHQRVGVEPDGARRTEGRTRVGVRLSAAERPLGRRPGGAEGALPALRQRAQRQLLQGLVHGCRRAGGRGGAALDAPGRRQPGAVRLRGRNDPGRCRAASPGLLHAGRPLRARRETAAARTT